MKSKHPAPRLSAPTEMGESDQKPAEGATASTESIIGPTSLHEFGGQSELVKRVSRMVEAARAKGEVICHFLLVGPAGSGRTTLAHIIARELGVSLHVANAEDIERPTDLAAMINNLEKGDVLLLKDFGRVRRPVAQRLETAMREFEFHIVVGEGMGARTMKLAVSPFTLLGSVTREGECDRRLRGAFDMELNFKPYSLDEMKLITERLASQLGIVLEAETTGLIARVSDGNPGKALNTVRRLMTHSASKRPTHAEASEVLQLLGVRVGSEEWSGGAAAEFANLSPIDLEHLIADLLRRMGFEAQTTQATGDGGIDVEAVLEKPIVGGRYLFQCKRYAPDNPVGSAAVREFYGAVHADRRAVKGVFITTSTFTPQAREFAQELPIELIDGERLRMLFEEAPSPSS